MKTLSIREARAAMSKLDRVLAKEGEITITRHGRPIARVVPPRPRSGMPSNDELRASLKPMKVGSEVLIREDRNRR